MDEKELQNIIRQIVERVAARLGQETLNQKSVLVIVPAYTADTVALTAYLKQKYQDGFECAVFEQTEEFEGIKTTCIKTEQDKAKLLASMKYYTQTVLAVPPLGIIKRIAEGDDSGFCEQLFLKSVLWEKKISMLLDFEKPKFRRGTFFESLSDSLMAIEQMGVEVVSLKPSVKKAEEGLSLISEADIIDAEKSGSMRVRRAPDAIVTQLASDKAKELGVAID